MRFVATFLLTLVAAMGGVTTVASAHRVHSVDYVEGRMRAFIRERQCKGDIFWVCSQTMRPFAIQQGNHSWRWKGDYYFRTFGGDTAICYTTGTYVDHNVLWPDGQILLRGDTVYNSTKSGPHC